MQFSCVKNKNKTTLIKNIILIVINTSHTSVNLVEKHLLLHNGQKNINK